MDSPSAQLVPQMEVDEADIDGPPSSPFVTEVDPKSRIASAQWTQSFEHDVADESIQDIFVTPHRPSHSLDEDKENMPETEAIREESLFSSRKLSSSGIKRVRTSPDSAGTREGSDDSVLMPPPSTTDKTPKRSPQKSLRSAVHTPRSVSRSKPSETYNDENTAQFDIEPRSFHTPPQDQTNIDDTGFTAFSEIPDMALFGKSGTKRDDMLYHPGRDEEVTPRTSRKRSSPSRSPSPTPRRLKTPAHTSGETTTSFLIDFTQQIEGIGAYRPSSPSKSTTQPNLLQFINNQRSPQKPISSRSGQATPVKSNSILNLLDFELPPAPTPRSVPTITVRELESLKSSYLSQISSLKATLSGREAEVESLKRAVGDAERRVGEAQESLREEKSQREHVEQEKATWEQCGDEVEKVLKNVKEEVLKSETEREELVRKMEDTEHRLEEAEARAVKAEERYADALAARVGASEGEDGNDVEQQVQRLVAAQIDAKIEAVSRELHAVYKQKHEKKVSTLKMSYEARSEKKTAELQKRVGELEKQNEELQTSKEAAFSSPHAGSSSDAELKVQIEEHKAHLARLEHEMQTSKQQQDQLMQELQQERIEKGDLVAAVDEMLALQADQGTAPSGLSIVEDFRKSISRPSGLRTPAASSAGESRIGRGGVSKSAIGGIGKSRMLAKIERMGQTGSGGGTGHLGE